MENENNSQMAPLVEEAIKGSMINRGISYEEIQDMMGMTIKELIVRKNAELNMLCVLISVDGRIGIKSPVLENIYEIHGLSPAARDICVMCGIFAIPRFSEIEEKFEKIIYSNSLLEFTVAFCNYIELISDYIDADLQAYYLQQSARW